MALLSSSSSSSPKITSISSSSVGETVFPATPKAGVRRWLPHMTIGLVVLTLIYAGAVSAFEELTSVLGLPPADSTKICPHQQQQQQTTTKTAAEQQDEEETTGDGASICSRGADLFAFQVVCLLAMTCMSSIGFVAWHVTGRAHRALPATPEGRLFGYLPEADALAAISLTFQVWDLLLSLLVITDLHNYVMLAHHVMAATVSLCSLLNHNLHYYGIYFLGISELSSVFLSVITLGRYFPPSETEEPGSLYARMLDVCGFVFAVTFIVYRVILWWPVSANLVMDVRSAIRSGTAERFRPKQTWILWLFVAMNIPLGAMQLYWLSVILKEAVSRGWL